MWGVEILTMPVDGGVVAWLLGEEILERVE
jgi:hypothetical protein